MTTFLLWLLLSFCCFIIAAMLISYALWYYENQKVLDLTNQIKQKNQSSILNTGMGKRGFSSFDLNASITKSKTLAKDFLAGAVTGASTFAKTVKDSNILNTVGIATKRAAKGVTIGLSGLIKPIRDIDKTDDILHNPSLTPEEEKVNNYQADVDKLILDTNESDPNTQSKATLDLASKNSSQVLNQNEELSVFEKLELRILNRLKESGMTNYDIWIELGALYKKFGQTDKAKEVFALVLKHAGDTNKEKARNELIGLS
jgi:hypothetical protein